MVKKYKGSITYIADTVEDLLNSEAKYTLGDKCLIAATGDHYISNSAGEWSLDPEFPPVSGNGGTSTQAGMTATDKENVTKEINAAVEKALKEIGAFYRPIKFDISSLPEGGIVNYRDKEIRVMCPAGTEFKKQTVGATGNPNMYYMAFKAYAPEGAVSFKEGDQGVVLDEMHTFDDAFAGTDAYGRNYSICWLALASYNESTGAWTYYGANSNTTKYIGWTYVVEWYDINGKMIDTDSVRINLTNEACHNRLTPWYKED